MSSDERQFLLEMKVHLEGLLSDVEDDLIVTDPGVEKDEYDFLIKKARMYRANLDQINKSLKRNQ